MKINRKKNGFSLTEMVVVVAIIALLATLGLPAIRSLKSSFESGSGIESIINSALSTARAIAAKEQRYAGIRFQLDLHDNQYMIFIIHDPERTNLSNGFRALEGQKPLKLPEDSRVIDMMIGSSLDKRLVYERQIEERDLEENTTSLFFPTTLIENIYNTSCFSIVFSPSGKLVIHNVRVRNRNGIYQPDNGESDDDIFNSPSSIQNLNTGMFIQDDYHELLSIGEEQSRNKFYIYEKSYFDKLENSEDRFEYLSHLEPVFINQYTGTIVKSN